MLIDDIIWILEQHESLVLADDGSELNKLK